VEEAIVECWDAVSDWSVADSSVKVVCRESVDGPWMDRFILVDDPLHMLRLSGPCTEGDGSGKTTGLRSSSAS
jgi:hypothetical protein